MASSVTAVLDWAEPEIIAEDWGSGDGWEPYIPPTAPAQIDVVALVAKARKQKAV
jgi:hypothetical protein